MLMLRRINIESFAKIPIALAKSLEQSENIEIMQTLELLKSERLF